MGIHLDHISLLVKDLEAAEADWTRILEALAPGHTLQITRGEGLDDVDGHAHALADVPEPRSPRGLDPALVACRAGPLARQGAGAGAASTCIIWPSVPTTSTA